ncbi:MAG: GNAT family N-acetyltransferase [Candidatus Levyibacteriota bacterium]
MFSAQSTSPNVSIIEAEAIDWEPLFTIYKDEDLPVDLEKAMAHVQWDFAQIGKDRKIWYAVIEGMRIGSLQLVFDHQQKDLANGKDTAYLHHFRIAKMHQGKGIGSLLVKHAEHEAKKHGFTIMTLEVEKLNSKAQQIYEHLGYAYFRESSNLVEIAMKKAL